MNFTSFIFNEAVRNEGFQEIIHYNKKDENSVANYVQFLENLLSEKQTENFTEFNRCIEIATDHTLKTSFIKRKEFKKLDEPWMTREIKSEIAKKRDINKARRKETDMIRLSELDNQFHIQKAKVQILTNDAITNLEEN